MKLRQFHSLVLFSALLCRASFFVYAEPPSRFDRSYNEITQPFLETYCFNCHAREKPKGGFDMRSLVSATALAQDERRGRQMLDQLISGQMPPEEAKKQPTTRERARLIEWLKSAREDEGRRNAGDPGIVLARRLGNAEYDYTIRDLTGVDIRPAKEFPVDPANEDGFDNSGESLMMSPALLKKYLDAARRVTDHLVFKTDGLAFAPFPVIADTDRDKYSVQRIIQFYQRQPTNYSGYFQAAWEFKNRRDLGKPNATLDEIAAGRKLSPKYLGTVWTALNSGQPQMGPLAALQLQWRELPAPGTPQSDQIKARCDSLGRFVGLVRERVKVKVPNLSVAGMNPGASAIVLWKDREMASNRRNYGGGALELKLETLTTNDAVLATMAVPRDPAVRQRYEETFKQFCAVFPDAFYIGERGRVFLPPEADKENTGRYLSAGFHNQMGYFRDDQPLCEMILDDKGRRELDKLWQDFDFFSDIPARMHSGLVWFERSESRFLRGEQFDFARAEDKDVYSEPKLKKFAALYYEHAREETTNQTTLKAIAEHFERSNSNIRRVEQARVAAEPRQLDALIDFAVRAYRHPLAREEREDILSYYKSMRQTQGLSHEEAIRDSIVSILMSPHFCYRVDLPMAEGGMRPLSDYALASRLSYFLWSSMPDQELLAHAAAGDLRQPQVLVAQAHRLLNDSRARGFATEFTGNWLDVRRFEEHNAVDRDRFPQFNPELREAMFGEPIRFFQDVVQNDRSILDLINANDTFVNPVLARHYGMPVVSGSSNNWTRVSRADQFGRGGLLPMAVFLTKNAPGLRTSPVKRGYWVVRRILGEHIPPPPPKVPELPSDETKLGDLTLREVLAKHRGDKSCSVCHARFDSMGLVFEGYGPVGERRNVDLAGKPVDVRAVFPGGKEGSGLEGLRAYIRAKREADFVDNLCRKTLAYGLGRTLQLSDESLINEMKRKLGRNQNRFSTLIESIVTSPQFLNKRGLDALSKE